MGRMGKMAGWNVALEAGIDLRTRAEQSIPRLRAAYFQAIQAYASGLNPGALPSADYIAQTLQRQTDSVLGKPGARVLLGAIIAN